MAGILDALGDLDHTEVVFVSGTQVAKSETGRCALGYWVDGIPGPPGDVLIVYPTQDAAEETIEQRVIPMFKASGRLRRWLTKRAWDLKKGQMTLAARRIFVGWATSPQALASRPCRFVVLEEEDKFPPWRGREASASALADDRTMTFEGYAKKYRVSTPTIEEGPIWQAWLACPDRRRWNVPCPRCGVLQPLVWERFKWDGQEVEDVERFGQLAEELLSGERAVWYACAGCGGEIAEAEKRDLVSRGQWVSDGYPPGQHPRSTRVGFHMWAACSPFVTWRKLVAEFLKAKKAGLGELQNWWNAYRGEPFAMTRENLDERVFLAKAARHEGGLVPGWARGLVAGADGGRSGAAAHWWWTVRAWGARGRSRLVATGKARSMGELLESTIDARWPVEGLEGEGAFVRPRGVLVDAGGGDGTEGSMTDQVLAAAKHNARVVPVRGRGGQYRSARDPRAAPAKTGQAAEEGVPPLMLDVNHYKDLVSGWISTPNVNEPTELWEESTAAGAEYAKHMSAEQKVVEHGKTLWKKKSETAPNHLWDASIYCAAGRDHFELDDDDGAMTVQEEFEARARFDAEQAESVDPPEADGPPWYDPDRWEA